MNEDDILKVAPGQRVLLRHEGHERRPAAGDRRPHHAEGRPGDQDVPCLSALPDDTPLKIGMSVEANIVVAEVNDALVLPAEAITSGNVFKCSTAVA